MLSILRGSCPEWSNLTWRHIIKSELTGYERIAYIDLHTGLGQRGRAEPIFRGGRDAGAFARPRSWYGDALTRSEDGTSSSTPIVGNTASTLADELGSRCELTAITLEFGTQSGLQVLAALRADNWLWQRGYPCGPDANGIRALMTETFAPEDPAWREAVLEGGCRVVGQAVKGFGR